MEERITSFIERYNIRDGAFAVVGTTFVPLRYIPRNQPINNIYVVHDGVFIRRDYEKPKCDFNEAKTTVSIPIPSIITWYEKIDDGT